MVGDAPVIDNRTNLSKISKLMYGHSMKRLTIKYTEALQSPKFKSLWACIDLVKVVQLSTTCI